MVTATIAVAAAVIAERAGALTGIRLYPISSSSLMLILQPRIGGRTAAAVSANCLWSLFGISFGLAALYLSIVPFGIPFALAAALAVPLIWDLLVWGVDRRVAHVRSMA
jgi:hypothetical protein